MKTIIAVAILVTLTISIGQVYGSDGVKVLSVTKLTDLLNSTHLVGEVQNTSPSIAELIRVVGTLYDSDGKVVGVGYEHTLYHNTSSGEKSPFDIMIMANSISPNQIENYSVVASIGY